MIRAALLLAVLLALPCVGVGADEDPPPAAPVTGGLPPTVGFAHFDPGVAADRDAARLEPLLELGRALVKTVPVRWGRIEPEPPRGRPPRYAWADLDRAVLVWQLAGLEPVLVLSPRSPWASMPIDRTPWVEHTRKRLPKGDAELALAAGLGAAPPRDSAWRDWERFAGDVVERYDGDGRDDMPGLRRPLNYLQVLDRADTPSHWIGSPEQYMRLLHHAGVAAKKAHPRCRVVHAAIDLRVTGFDPIPDDDVWRHRVAALLPRGRVAGLEAEWGLELIARTLEMPRLYDIVPHVSGPNLADDAVNLRHLRAWLDRASGTNVATWLVDVEVAKLGLSRVPRALQPSKAEQRVRDTWSAVARVAGHGSHAKALDWARRGRCYDLVRSYCVAMAADAEAVLYFPREDQSPRAPLRVAETPSLPADLILEGKRGSLWNAWHQLVGHVEGHVGVSVSPLGSDLRSIVFEMPVERSRAWVAVLVSAPRITWAGEPGKPLPTRAITLPLPNGTYVLESVRTSAEPAERREVEVSEGMLITTVGPAPIYVIPKD